MTNPYPPQPPKRLVRSASNRVIGGVCGGVADYLNMDVTLVRILTVLISLFTGVPVILYIIALFIVPEGTTVPTAPPPVTGASTYSGPFSGPSPPLRRPRTRPSRTPRREREGAEPDVRRPRRPSGAVRARRGSSASPRPRPPTQPPSRPPNQSLRRSRRRRWCRRRTSRRPPRTSRRPDPPLRPHTGRPGDQVCGRCASSGADQIQEVAVNAPVGGDFGMKRGGQQGALLDRDDVGLVVAPAA